MAVSAAGTRHKVLLTGAAGFVGSHLARLLIHEGHDVTAIVRPDSDRWRIADVDGLNLIHADLTNLAAIKPHLRAQRADICIHLAWKGWSGKAEADANLTSLGISLELLRSMSELGIKRFVAAGTCFEYHLAARRLSEASPLVPHDLYGICKKSLFEVADEFSQLTGVSVVTPRLFYSYGPYEDQRRLVPSIVQALLRGEVAKVTPGAQIRDYLHVEDIARAIWMIATSDATAGVNVASGDPVTIAQVATRLAEIVGRPDLLALGQLHYRDGEPMHILGDATKLRRTLGFVPQYDLNSGLRQTVDWWRERVAVA